MVLGRRRKPVVVSSPANVSESRNALTASGTRVRKADSDGLRRLAQPWQTRAFSYYDLLGEIKYGAQFYARGLSQLVLYAAEKDENGDLVATENPEAKAALDRIQDPGGGRSGLLSAYGRLMFLVGESLLCVTTEDGNEQWEMLSSDELRMQGSTYMRIKAPSLAAEELREATDDDFEPLTTGEAVVYRLWQRHPRYSMLADSTMQGVLDLCEELVLLTQSVRARARSRLAGSGVLFLDSVLSPPPDEAIGDEDPAEDIFLSDLVEAMTTPIVDEGAASAVVPMVVRGSVPEGRSMRDLVHHLQIVDPTQLYPETGLRYECIKRIAIGLDMPPEELMGLQDSNHWSGWMVDEKTWKAHLQPKAQQLVDDLTASYYRPTLRESGLADWEKYSIAYDATAIINHPDRTKDGKDLYDKRVIGKAALREAAGFDEEDAPTKEELAEMVGVATRDSSLAWFGIPTVRGGSVETAPGEVTDSGTDGTAATGADVEPGPPDDPTPVSETVVGGANGYHAQALAARIVGAADVSVLRAREAAGNRLRSLAKRDPDMLLLLEGVAAGKVAATLGRAKAQELKCPSDLELVAASRPLVLDALRIFGIEDEQVAGKIADSIELHAARTLYDENPAPLPPQFANYVAGLAVGATR